MFRRSKKNEEYRGATSDSTLQALRKIVPNYIGYDALSDRAQTDQAIRTYWYEHILKLIDAQSMVKNQLMTSQLLSTWAIANQILNNLNYLRTFLKSDTYRHSTFFETPNIHEIIEVSVIYILEHETILELKDLLQLITGVSSALSSLVLTSIEKDMVKINRDLEELKTTIIDRSELIASFELVSL